MISKAELKDVDAIASLVNSAYRGTYAKKGWTTEADMIDGTRTDAPALTDLLKRPDTTILKYERDGNIIGCVELKISDRRAYLGMLTVEPSIQGGGIGKEMLRAAEDFAKQQNCTSVYMTVITIRTELVDWYKRHGYVDTGERKPFNFNDPRFGQPKQKLEFLVLEKQLQV
ncbi:MAG TPA: GNAT family N-acetyltransferase [Cyclobacteriaceae bacterium]|nr:GNAT family N-acetyltransferase [Cyclobacteriaceae bacterium]